MRSPERTETAPLGTHGPEERATEHTVVGFREVSKVYGSGPHPVKALDRLSVEIRRGEFTAIMGPSGSGKSTFMNLAAGLDDVSDGECWLAGHPLHLMDDRQRTLLRREHTGFVFQSFNLVPALTVHENVLLPFELAGRRVDEPTARWIAQLLESLGLADRRDHRPSQLSGGQQQRVAIARALAPRPSVVFADEPTGNLDTRTSREVLALLRAAVQDYQQSIAMVSHDPVAASCADRVLVIADGRIVADHPRLRAAEISDLLIGIEEDAA